VTAALDFSAVDRRYEALYARACEVFAADDRVVRVEVHGSIATGTADQWSDLDLKVITRDDAHGAVVDEWETWLAAITPTVLADRPIAPFVVNAVTANGLTFDISVWGESLTDFPMPTGLGVGFLSGKRFDNYPDAVWYAVHEQLRGASAAFIKFVKRGQHIAHLMGIGHTLSLLQCVLLAEADAPIDGRRPAEHLPEEAKAVIAGLPPLHATYDSLVAFESALCRETLVRGRKLFAKYGFEWPSALEAVAAENIRKGLGIEVDWS